MSIRLFRRPAALIRSLALLPALSPAALAAGAPAVSDKKSALIRHSANFQTRPGPDKLQCLFGETAIAVSGLRCVCRDLIYSQRS